MLHDRRLLVRLQGRAGLPQPVLRRSEVSPAGLRVRRVFRETLNMNEVARRNTMDVSGISSGVELKSYF